MLRKEKAEKESFKRRWFTRANEASHTALRLSRRFGGGFCKSTLNDLRNLKDLFRPYSAEEIEDDEMFKTEMDMSLRLLENEVYAAQERLERKSRKERERWLLEAQAHHLKRHSRF